MSENRYFQKALSDFTYDAASGGAIRHLTDTGYTVKQIMETLTYPTPYERVQKTVWKHLLDTGTILLDIPGTEKQHEKITYVREYNKYGKASFRKVVEKQEDKEILFFTEYTFVENDPQKFSDFLLEKCHKNQNEAYVSCKFGLWKRDSEPYKKLSDLLDKDQIDYILGLPWEKKICYHKLDKRMQHIVLKLFSEGNYHECFFFLKTAEKVKL